MKRRNFLKAVAGITGAIGAGPKIQSAKPRGFAFDYAVNNDTDVFQPISRDFIAGKGARIPSPPRLSGMLGRPSRPFHSDAESSNETDKLAQ